MYVRVCVWRVCVCVCIGEAKGMGGSVGGKRVESERKKWCVLCVCVCMYIKKKESGDSKKDPFR